MSPYMLFGLAFTGLMHILISKDFVAKQIGGNNLSSIIKASLFGVPLPLCSCGVIPTAVFMRDNGASKSSTVSFLTSTPQTGIDSIIATYGVLGWVFAVFRPFAALVMGVFGGIMTAITNKEKKSIEKPQMQSKSFVAIDSFIPKKKEEPKKEGFTKKLKKMWNYATVEFLDDIALHFIIGVIIAGLIAYFVPSDLIADTQFSSGILGMLVMIVIGIPMYICATASIPIAAVLMAKGVSPGVAFVFLAVGPVTNAATLSVIIKSLGKKATSVYMISIIVSSIAMGYLLEFVFKYYKLPNFHIHEHSHHSWLPNELSIALAIFFFSLLVISIIRKNFGVSFQLNKKN